MSRKAHPPEPPDDAGTYPEALPPPPRRVEARPGRAWLRRCLPLLFIPHVWIGLGLPIVAAVNVLGMIDFHLRGEVVPGRVTNLATHTSRKGGRSFSVSYTYQAGGAEHTAESPIYEAGFGLLAEGDPVQVRVLPGSSRRPQLLAPGAPTEWSGWGGVLFFMLGWDGLLLVGFWPRSVRPLLQRTLVRSGAATDGSITAKDTQTVKGTTYYKVRYRYRTPVAPRADAGVLTDEATGRDWERTMTVEEEDYTAVSVGTRVTVLYSRWWPWWSIVYRCAAYRVLSAAAGEMAS
jgi:hypothetical protein